MIYVISAAVGLLYGAAMGGFKYIAIWRGFIRQAKSGAGFDRAIYIRMPLDYIVNILTLVLLFLVRNSIPLDFTATAIAAALGLSVAGRFFSIKKIFAMSQAGEQREND